MLKKKRLESQLKVATDELTYAKTQLKKIEQDYTARISNQLKVDIQDVLGLDDTEVAKLTHGKTIEELEAMLNNFVLATKDRKAGEPGIFKPIRTDVEPKKYGDNSEDFTVGCLYNKTPEEIRKMGGAF